MRTLLAGVCFLLATTGTPACAQPAPDAQEMVRDVLDGLFDAMRTGDSTAVRAVFVPSARIQSIDVQSDAMQTRTAGEFARSVGAPRDAIWDERIWSVDIQVDGPMAMVRAPYVFYLGDTLSHCGVNALHLRRRDDAWQVVHITYTRRPADTCEVPPEVAKG